MFFMFFVIGVCGSIFWVWTLIDCAMKEPDSGNTKIVWILVIIFTHLLGSLLYFLVRRPQRIAEVGR